MGNITHLERKYYCARAQLRYSIDMSQLALVECMGLGIAVQLVSVVGIAICFMKARRQYDQKCRDVERWFIKADYWEKKHDVVECQRNLIAGYLVHRVRLNARGACNPSMVGVEEWKQLVKTAGGYVEDIPGVSPPCKRTVYE